MWISWEITPKAWLVGTAIRSMRQGGFGALWQDSCTPKTQQGPTRERPSSGKEDDFPSGCTVINSVDSIPSHYTVTSVTLSPKTGQGKGFELPGFVEPHSEPCSCQFVLGVTGSWH